MGNWEANTDHEYQIISRSAYKDLDPWANYSLTALLFDLVPTDNKFTNRMYLLAALTVWRT